MICITIIDFGYDNCLRSLRKCERLDRELGSICVELKLDLCGLSSEDVENLCYDSKIPVIVTCSKKSLDQVEAAVIAGVSYVDIDTLSSNTMYDTVLSIIGHKRRLKKILSYYNYSTTPPLSELKKIYRHSVKRGADIVKIVTTAKRIDDVERVLSLYDLIDDKEEFPDKRPLVAYCMGNKGTYSRIESHRLGAPFIFCSLNTKSVFSPGQITIDQLTKMKMPCSLNGCVDIPASKSIAQRAIIAAAMAQGESEFHNFTSCSDTDAALAVATQLGATMQISENTLFLRGEGLPKLKKKKNDEDAQFSISNFNINQINLFVGESGLLSRLCIPLAAQVGSDVSITGKGVLMGRKMYGCKDALEQYEAKCILTAEDTLPAVVCGPLSGGKVTISGKKGSQLISGLLMALPIGKKDSVLTVENPTSIPYIQLTLDVIKKFGIEMTSQVVDGNLVFTIPSKQKYSPIDISLEGDWSLAANFIAAAAIFGSITLSGLNINSIQADKKILELIINSGGSVLQGKKDIKINTSHLKPFEFDVVDSPNLFPIVVVLALYCQGVSQITGIDKLKNSESNISEQVVSELKKMGASIYYEEDILFIEGNCLVKRMLEGTLLKGGSYSSYQDHRLAMALKVASIGCKDKVTISGMDSVSKSFPNFEKTLDSVIKSMK
jgi:3-phosphoshikimate 1-carboxyvinyltransferase